MLLLNLRKGVFLVGREISFAESFRDGINFFVKDNNGKRYVICARMAENGKVTATIHDGMAKGERPDNNKKTQILAVATLIFLSFEILFKFIFPHASAFLAICVGLWFIIISHAKAVNSDLNNKTFLRYHGAEHKALNFFYLRNQIPESLDELRTRRIYLITCGSAICTAVLVFFTIIAVCYAICAETWWVITSFFISFVVTAFLWILDKCNFVQKYLVDEPTTEELEVAFEALKKLDELP